MAEHKPQFVEFNESMEPDEESITEDDNSDELHYFLHPCDGIHSEVVDSMIVMLFVMRDVHSGMMYELNIISLCEMPPCHHRMMSHLCLHKVIVEGNIGCGKSTFLNYFKRYKNVEVCKEPVDEWKNVMGYNALKPHSLKMLERSIYSTRHCFMENLRENQLIPSVDYSILKEYHKWVDQHEDIQVDLIVYLRASPEICADRMRKRNRSEEAGVPLEYLQALHRLHDDWLLHGKRGKLPAPVLVLDANKDLSELQQEVAGLSQDILCGMTCVPKDEETAVTT
ncbi:thymidine kinase 2, mitochondrial-like [Plakobranchus ocellatus]|uniref:Thymidine kinase 2, mitochondrial-like n=1 Tax=Plakobranchus ocellatus TaxID=259542 RepID=A0AAV3Z3I1_9GAST|nr:thymidine kinase 2, mitochondrial-like [Plakobranchus ocellatus]